MIHSLVQLFIHFMLGLTMRLVLSQTYGDTLVPVSQVLTLHAPQLWFANKTFKKIHMISESFENLSTVHTLVNRSYYLEN